MAELDKQVSFSAFHILLVVISINLFVYGDSNYIINLINYVINIETPGFWFIILHVVTLYLILSNLTFEFGFRAAIKFNL